MVQRGSKRKWKEKRRAKIGEERKERKKKGQIKGKKGKKKRKSRKENNEKWEEKGNRRRKKETIKIKGEKDSPTHHMGSVGEQSYAEN